MASDLIKHAYEMKPLKKKTKEGAPGWLSHLSV